MILLIDNYDSFVHNLARTFRELGCETLVVRNDAISADELARRRFEAIVISPGPCTPAESGISVPLLRSVEATTPVLGVCLGHQAIAVAFGGGIERVEPVHGQGTLVWHRSEGLFSGIPCPFVGGRYHSLAVRQPVPDVLQVDATGDDGMVMALSHRTAPIYGVQFHPESVLTEHGHALLANFLRLASSRKTEACALST